MSKDRDGRVSQAQMKKLLDLLSTDGTLLDGRVVYKDTNKLKFWKRIAVQLNSVENGVVKNFHKWCKMWADWKNKTKRKADIVLRRKFGNQKPNFTKLELRLLKLINYPIHDVLGVLNEEKRYDQTQEIDKLSEDLDPVESNVDDNLEGFNEDNREFISLGVQDKQDSSHCYDIFVSDTQNISSDIGGVDIKEEEKDSSNTETLDYRAKTKLDLEKERVHQKSEELRLKALELKLKGDELKLQETEVSRVNYLTQLEEQKLKCMMEIAASLKELVEWTRNGSTRFHNVMQ
ncbi:uncharacterized protein LOC123873241 isoform X1 [Maniola jurtina]|uniref:uncharacterized protein LOC123873241 isoform X1 n=1 Tax=Maniola jurtina TaxID=191418 RepID=UPI001E68BD4A|nr:uncharacterized protein LOC123873241 isoform X1 [Maniola jurtina]